MEKYTIQISQNIWNLFFFWYLSTVSTTFIVVIIWIILASEIYKFHAGGNPYSIVVGKQFF
jgi:hypothetical protein